MLPSYYLDLRVMTHHQANPQEAHTMWWVPALPLAGIYTVSLHVSPPTFTIGWGTLPGSCGWWVRGQLWAQGPHCQLLDLLPPRDTLPEAGMKSTGKTPILGSHPVRGKDTQNLHSWRNKIQCVFFSYNVFDWKIQVSIETVRKFSGTFKR